MYPRKNYFRLGLLRKQGWLLVKDRARVLALISESAFLVLLPASILDITWIENALAGGRDG